MLFFKFLRSKSDANLSEIKQVIFTCALNKKGYTVVRFDPAGTWESEGDISEYTVTQYLEDIKNILEYMLKKSAYKEILLGGHSRGGVLSILYAARDSRISSVLAIMPSSDRSMTNKRRGDWKKTGVCVSQRDLPSNPEEKREFRVPYSHVEDRDQYDVISDVKKIKIPIVFIAEGDDILVFPEDVKILYDNANDPKKFLTIPHIDHDYRLSDSKVKIVNDAIIELIK